MVVQGVAKHVREVFRDLAPGGRGELVMQKRIRQEPGGGADGAAGGEGEPEEEEEGAEGGDASAITEKYSGVKVKVSSARQALSLKPWILMDSGRRPAPRQLSAIQGSGARRLRRGRGRGECRPRRLVKAERPWPLCSPSVPAKK